MKKFSKIILMLASTLMITLLIGCNNQSNNSSKDGNLSNNMDKKTFVKFEATDFNGNKIDNSLFKKNSVTVVNFWFNECPACVEELPILNTLNNDLNKQGAEVIGINLDAGLNKDFLNTAKQILSKQGVTYRNISYSKNTSLEKFANSIEGFPTTFLVDRNGNIIGDPIIGSIVDETYLNEVKQHIKKIIDKDNEKK